MTPGRRGRLWLAMGITAALVAAVTIAVIGPRTSKGRHAVVVRPTPGVAKTWVPAYMSNDLHYTTAEAVQLAHGADLVAGVAASFRHDAGMMRAANPHLTLLAYENATFTTPGDAAQSADSEFAHDAAGGRIRSRSFGTYLMEPSSPIWQQHTVHRCIALAAGTTYDGCLVDTLTMAVFSPGYATAVPVNPATHQAYTQRDWQAQLVSLATAYNDEAVGDVIVGNAVGDAARYWAPSDVASRPIAMALPGAQFENFLRGAGDPAYRFPTVSEWQQDLRIVQDLESSGKTGLFSTKLWSAASPEQVAAWQSYAMASFLLAANGHSYFAFTDGRDKAGVLGTTAPYRMPTGLGAPTGSMTQNGLAFLRHFGNGLAVVNPSATTVSVDLGGTYRGLGGSVVTTVSLPPHSGNVYLRA